MDGTGNIQYLNNQQIDKKKWDQCIEQAPNGLIYAYSFYLDAMAENWDALVLDDYKVVMPLTWKRKYGIHYLYQPFLTAQLGVFGSNISGELLEIFLVSIPKKFKYIDICLNYQNIFQIQKFSLYQRNNYVLDLNYLYDDLSGNYNTNTNRNIMRSQQALCKVQTGVDIVTVIDLSLKQMKIHSKATADNVNRFRKLYQLLESEKRAITYGVSLKNELVATAVFFFSHNRAYYILVGNHPKSKTFGASHRLIDAFIKDNADRMLLLDFEGSDIPSLAKFYSSFGAVEEKYAALRLNRLPFYLKWMKK